MHRVHQQELPFGGISHDLVGAGHGDVSVCAYLLNAPPGRGPGPHRHPRDEVQFIREGRARHVVDGREADGGAPP